MVNTSDFITQVPLPVMPSASSTEFTSLYDHTVPEIQIRKNMGTLAENHFLPVYIIGVEEQMAAAPAEEEEANQVF